MGRTRLPPEERRRELLERGLETFARQAYDEVSMDEFCRRVGISKGLVFHYFGSKRGFYVEVVRTAIDDLAVRTAPEPGLPALTQLEESLLRYLQYVEVNREAYQRLMRGGMEVDPRVGEIVDNFRETVAQRIIDGLGGERSGEKSEPQDARSPHVVVSAPAVRVALRGWVGFLEAASLAWAADPRASKETLVRIFTVTLATSLIAAGVIRVPIPKLLLDQARNLLVVTAEGVLPLKGQVAAWVDRIFDGLNQRGDKPDE